MTTFLVYMRELKLKAEELELVNVSPTCVVPHVGLADWGALCHQSESLTLTSEELTYNINNVNHI